MDLFEAIEARRSIRRFDPAVEVPPETVEKLLRAAIMAPTGGNRQPWHFYVVRDAALRAGLMAAAYGQGFIGQAPVAIVVCADADKSGERYGQRGRELYCLQDTAAAVEHMLLGAAALGLGTCWVGAFDEGEAARALNLPANHRPVAIVPIGKPAEAPARRPRQALDEVVTYR